MPSGHQQMASAGLLVAIAAATAAVRFLRLRLSHSSSAGACSSGCKSSLVLVLCGKSPKENEVAQTLKSKLVEQLGKEEKDEIRVVLHSELESDDRTNFETEFYMKTLLTSQFGRLLIWSPRLPSTHDIVSKNFCELPVGSVCVADIQFKGRGRGKNVWESPVGSISFSFTVQMEDGLKLPLLQYVVSLSVTEAIKEACEANGFPKLYVLIKWPNDLYLNGLKIGGILCTSTYRSKKFDVCVGIGLNIDNEKPTTCLNAALQEIASSSSRLTREDIIASFFNKFEQLFEVFSNQGFHALEELYYQTWLHSGQKVVIEEKHEGQPDTETSVTIQGLTPSGYLLATDEENKEYELHPDGNTFDFFKGLVRRKLG